MRPPEYPFVPKSTSLLRRGQFWSLPLERGLFGAGCVVGVHTRQGKPSTRSFIAGVVKWVGTKPPTVEALRGLKLERYGFAHIKSITTTGGEVLGTAAINLNGVPETAEDRSLEAWGFNVVRVVAQKLAREQPQMYIRVASPGGDNVG